MTNEPEVPYDEQAQMAIKLADSVQELVEKAILATFNDEHFLYTCFSQRPYTIANVLGTAFLNDYNFQRNLKSMLVAQLTK